jgi:hypothetical protein
MSLREFLVKDCCNNKQIQSCKQCLYEKECNQIHIDLIMKALKEWLEVKYKEYYDSHGEFVCPPAVTVGGLIRELENCEIKDQKPL